MKPSTAISKAVVARLRDQITALTGAGMALDETNCNFEIDGHPPPSAPHVYISVAEAGITTKPGPVQNQLETKYRVDVFVSIRTGTQAVDRIEEIYDRSRGALDAFESEIVAALHDKQAVRALANANLPANAAEFLYPLTYNGRTGTELKSAAWSHEIGHEDEIAEAVGWIVRKLPFVGGDRIEYSSEII